MSWFVASARNPAKSGIKSKRGFTVKWEFVVKKKFIA